MSTKADKIEFLEKYRELCEKYRVYIEGPFGYPLLVQEMWFNVDRDFEKTMEKLSEDIGL